MRNKSQLYFNRSKQMKQIASLIVTVAFAVVAMGKDESPKTVFEQKSGGMVRREATGPKIVVIDGRKSPGKVLKYFEAENVEGHGTKPGLPVKAYAEVIDGRGATAKAFEVIGKEKSAMVIIVSECGADMPSLTVCPEDRIAVINADKYANKDFLLLKEVWRAIGFIGGVGYSKYSADPMQPVFSSTDLAKIQGSALLPTSLNALKAFNDRFDIKPAYTVPYIAAVRQGWAPAPTNEVQQAIWDKVHQIPDKPITIEFDPKTDK